MIEGVHIWRADLDEEGWPKPEWLPASERKRFEAFLRRDVAQRWANSRWALRRVLAKYLEEDPVAIELEFGKQGKPRLAKADGLKFNLSHSAGLALIAVAERPVGIDVELVRPEQDLKRLAERVLPKWDINAMNAVPAVEQPAIFYAAWTRHEARLKCLGVGLGGSPTAASFAANLEVAPGYAAAVAVASSEVGPGPAALGHCPIRVLAADEDQAVGEAVGERQQLRPTAFTHEEQRHGLLHGRGSAPTPRSSQ